MTAVDERPTTNAGWQYTDETYNSPLTLEQYTQLLLPVDGNRVGRANGQSNMEAYDIRAHLNRIFGFGNWDGEAEVMELIGERWGTNKNNNTAVTVVYRCRYTLRIRNYEGKPLATYTEWATGDAQNFPEFKYGDSHDFAMKTAESQALKRCAINLGDQFGLSLYRKGSLDPVVGWTLSKVKDTRDPVAAIEAAETRTVPDVVPEQDPDNRGHMEPNADGTWTEDGNAKEQAEVARGQQDVQAEASQTRPHPNSVKANTNHRRQQTQEKPIEGVVIRSLAEWREDWKVAKRRGPDAMKALREMALRSSAPKDVINAIDGTLREWERAAQQTAPAQNAPQGEDLPPLNGNEFPPADQQ